MTESRPDDRCGKEELREITAWKRSGHHEEDNVCGAERVRKDHTHTGNEGKENH